MTKEEFLEVSREFVAWAGKFRCDADGHLTPVGNSHLAKLSIDLNIPRSGKVPEAICREAHFFELTRFYSWRASGMTSGSFAETREKVEALSNEIRIASNDAEAIRACEEILRWGGDRNSTFGALPFLRSKPSLISYLNAVKANLVLNEAVIPPFGDLSAVKAMNSMLSKIHAFNSEDGLPIYDSRVAGAIATLVETWRISRGIEKEPIPVFLSFPEVGGGGERRSVRARYPTSIRPSTLRYSTQKQPMEHALCIARSLSDFPLFSTSSAPWTIAPSK